MLNEWLGELEPSIETRNPSYQREPTPNTPVKANAQLFIDSQVR